MKFCRHEIFVRRLQIVLLSGTLSGALTSAATQSPAAGTGAAPMAQSVTPQSQHDSSATSADHVLEASIEAGKVVARPAQTFRGWGMSLAWEANDLYGGGHQPAQIKDATIRSQYMDLLRGDPATRLTLLFNIVRYNIGGGDDPGHTHMRPGAQMEGYQAGPGAPYDCVAASLQESLIRPRRGWAAYANVLSLRILPGHRRLRKYQRRSESGSM